MEEPLKQLMQELGNAISDSLSESDRIAEVIGEIRRAGYDIFLVLEATIGFNRRNKAEDEEDEGEEEQAEAEVPKPEAKPKRPLMTGGKIRLTPQDQRFLRALKIAVEDDKR